jgi:hypothetical protein
MSLFSEDYLIFDKRAKNIRWRKASSTKVAGKTGYLNAENWISECRKLDIRMQKLDPCLSSCTSIIIVN